MRVREVKFFDLIQVRASATVIAIKVKGSGTSLTFEAIHNVGEMTTCLLLHACPHWIHYVLLYMLENVLLSLMHAKIDISRVIVQPSLVIGFHQMLL